MTPNRLPTFDAETTAFGAGRNLVMSQAADPLKGDSAVDNVSVRFVAATGQVLSASVVLAPNPAQPLGGRNYYATCMPCSGIAVDLAAGTVSFTDTVLTATILSGDAAPARLNGSVRQPDYRPRSGTTVRAADLAACAVTPNALSAAFADAACLAGTYVGTGIDGQACTVTIDAAAQTFRFDDGIKDNRFAYTLSGGYSNLSTFKSAFLQSAKMTRPGAPLEWIEVASAPVAGFPDLIKFDMRNIQAEGGTLNSVYHRECRIEFDLGAP